MSIAVKRSGAWSADIGYDALYRFDASLNPVVAQEVLRKVGASTWQQVWRKDGPPPNPTSVAATSANGGTNTVTWAWPANVENDYSLAEVEVAASGGAFTSMNTTAYPGTSQVRGGAANGTSYVYRVRFKDLGGNYSAWVNAAAVTGKDVNPNVPSVLVDAGDWVATSGGQFNVTIANIFSSYSDVSNVSLYRRGATTGAWTLVSSTGYTAASKIVAVADLGSDHYHEFYATVTSPGGTSTSTVKSVYSRPAAGSTKSIAASNSATYSIDNGAWRSDGDEVRQGRFDGSYGLQEGAYFYGTGMADLCRGHNPASAQIFMVRSGGSGFTGPITLQAHGYSTRPAGAPGWVSGWTGSQDYAGTDGSGWESIPVGLMDNIATGNVKGFGIYINSTAQANYRVMRGPNTNGFAGSVVLTF